MTFRTSSRMDVLISSGILCFKMLNLRSLTSISNINSNIKYVYSNNQYDNHYHRETLLLFLFVFTIFYQRHSPESTTSNKGFINLLNLLELFSELALKFLAELLINRFLTLNFTPS